MAEKKILTQDDIEAKVEYLFAHRLNKTLHAYIDIAGDLVAGALLSQIMYWFSEDKNGNIRVKVEKDGQYWLVKRREDWMSEIRISKKQYDCAIKKLTAEIEPTEEGKKKLSGNKGKRRKKAFDTEKALVEVKTFQWHGAPTTHIRPITKNINREIARWKKTLADEISRKNNIDIDDGCIPYSPKVNMEIAEREMSYNNNIYINNTNRDYITENTSNSISNDIVFNSFSKEKDINSTLPSNAAYVPFEERRKKHKYQKDRYTEEEKLQAEGELPERVKHIAYDYTGDNELAIRAADCIEYFVYKRRNKIKAPMKVFTEVTLYNLVLEMFREQEMINKDESMITVYSPLIHEDMEQEYKDVVDGYFDIDFTLECDYSLAHFLTGGVQARIKAKLPGAEWYTNCSM